MRFALLGTGNIASTYVKAVGNLPNAEITVLISRNIDRARKFAQQHDISKFSDSMSDFTEEFDAVIAATPNGLHHVNAIDAAELGKHVLVEKPLDITVENMDMMVSACREADVRLGVTFQRRFNPTNRIVKQMLDDRAFGDIYAIDLSMKFYRDQSYYESAAWRGTRELDGGGPFIQQGAHDIDLLCWFFGMPCSVFARAGTFAHTGIDVEDYGAAILGYDNGAIGTVIAGTISKPGFSPGLDIFTQKGTVSLENDSIIKWDVEGVEKPEIEGAEQNHNAATSVSVDDTSGHEAVIKDFICAIRDNREPEVNADTARMTTELILKIYESAESGKEIFCE